MIRLHLARSWRHHFSLQLTTVFVLSVVLVILSFVFSARENVAMLNESWGRGLELTLYLKDSASTGEVVGLRRELEKNGDFSKVVYVSKDEAAQKFLARMGHLAPSLFSKKPSENPLPASIELKLKDRSSISGKIDRIRAWAEKLAKNQLVDDVSYGQGWVENWASFLTSIQLLSALAVFMTLILGLLVIGNSIRVSLSQRREEIEILELVGATNTAIRWPFVVEGALLGFMAAVIGAVVGSLLQNAVFAYIKRSLSFWSVMSGVHALSWQGFVGLVIIGTVFGAVGAYVCVRHLNSGWSAAERLSQ